MIRVVLGSLLGLALCLGAGADDKKANNNQNDNKSADKADSKGGKKAEAKITNVDPKNHTVTVQMKDKDGKQTEKKFKLAETIRYFDSTGRVVAEDVFRSGDLVLVIEADGQIQEMHQKRDGKGEQKKGGDQGKKDRQGTSGDQNKNSK